MVTDKQHIADIKAIMGMEEQMVRLLPQLEKMDLLNPWIRQLPGVFRGLKLKPDQIVLDMPCGKGGVSVKLAKKYGVKVLGYDILDAYVKYAGKLAISQEVGHLCAFRVEDIRRTTKRKDICDVLLWIGPPHIWETSAQTIKALKTCVKDGGLILIGDAYLYKPSKKYPNYETLAATNHGYISAGDKIVKFINYKDALWKEDYYRTKKSVMAALKKVDNSTDQKIIRKYLKSLDQDEKLDSKYLGLGIWLIKVNKKYAPKNC